MVMKFGSNGILMVVAGNGRYGTSGDGGPATSAGISAPAGLALDPAGNLYISDASAAVIRKVTPDGIISTFVGTPAGFSSPRALAADAAGTIYVADPDLQRVYRISTNGTASVFAGNGRQGFAGDGGAALQASLNRPHGVAVDTRGNVLIADTGNSRIRRVSLDGVI